MPATAGRVRMPHNNRMSTSGALATSDIWLRTIGHDPYATTSVRAGAADASGGGVEASEDDNVKAKGLLELARHQKIAGDTTSRDDFARKLYLGLKGTKKRRKNDPDGDKAEDALGKGRGMNLVQLQESSSEDEFIQVKTTASRNKQQLPTDDGESTSSSSSSSDESSERRRRRRRRQKRRRRHEERKKKKKITSKHRNKHSRRHNDEDDSSSSDEVDGRYHNEERKRRRKKRKRRDMQEYEDEQMNRHHSGKKQRHGDKNSASDGDASREDSGKDKQTEQEGT